MNIWGLTMSVPCTMYTAGRMPTGSASWPEPKVLESTMTGVLANLALTSISSQFARRKS